MSTVIRSAPRRLFRDRTAALTNSSVLAWVSLGWLASFALMGAKAPLANALGVLLCTHTMVLAAYLIHEAAHQTLFAEQWAKGLRLKNRGTGVESILSVSAMFLGIGHTPNASAFKGMLDVDEDGYILTKNNVLTTLNGEVIPGVFACGDIQDRRYRQAITAAGSGCMAALEVEKYLEEHGR